MTSVGGARLSALGYRGTRARWCRSTSLDDQGSLRALVDARVPVTRAVGIGADDIEAHAHRQVGGRAAELAAERRRVVQVYRRRVSHDGFLQSRLCLPAVDGEVSP